jgi:hypothetical protein
LALAGVLQQAVMIRCFQQLLQLRAAGEAALQHHQEMAQPEVREVEDRVGILPLQRVMVPVALVILHL